MRYFGPFFCSTNFYFYLVFLRFPTISCFCFPITFLLILQKWKQPLVLTSKSTRLSGNCITVKPNVSWKKKLNKTWGRFIYILDSSNSRSFTFWSSQFACSSRSNWTSLWTGYSNGTWTDKQSSHFSTAKEISVKAKFFFM